MHLFSETLSAHKASSFITTLKEVSLWSSATVPTSHEQVSCARSAVLHALVQRGLQRLPALRLTCHFGKNLPHPPSLCGGDRLIIPKTALASAQLSQRGLGAVARSTNSHTCLKLQAFSTCALRAGQRVMAARQEEAAGEKVLSIDGRSVYKTAVDILELWNICVPRLCSR